MPQKNYKPHYEHLKNTWVDRKERHSRQLIIDHKEAFHWLSYHVRGVALGSLSTLLVATASPAKAASPLQVLSQDEVRESIDKSVFVVHDLINIVPKEVRNLSVEEENTIANMLTERFGIKVTAELSGKRLNTSYGFIGQEQHLARYPGDNMSVHLNSQEDFDKYSKFGMAPGLGAWRYFADSFEEMTQKQIDQEKYHIAVQTFLSPGFYDNVRDFIEFYKFRKMLLVNPDNGKAIIAVIGDAGPAPWTGKHLGGSPEVMDYLDRVDGSQKGPVLYFFVDDPEDRVPLGPIEQIEDVK